MKNDRAAKRKFITGSSIQMRASVWCTPLIRARTHTHTQPNQVYTHNLNKSKVARLLKIDHLMCWLGACVVVRCFLKTYGLGEPAISRTLQVHDVHDAQIQHKTVQHISVCVCTLVLFINIDIS